MRSLAGPAKCAGLALAALLAGCHAAPASRAGLAVGSSSHTLNFGGMERTFRVYRPAGLPDGPVPLVVMLHGALGTGSQAESSYGWDAEADRGHFVVAYPDGYKRSWAVSDDCCGPPAASHVDDPGFVREMIARIAGLIPIDPARRYATGISNGGMLAYRLACGTDSFAAIGPDSATMLGACPSPAPTSVIHIHGAADQTVPYNGGPGKRDNGGQGTSPANVDGPAIPALAATWRATDRCGEPATSTAGDVTRATATCPGGRAVELITIAGAGHQWPGQPGPRGAAARALGLDPPSDALDATHTIWTFFAAHPRGG
ncbi:extracellular catalytic domain type 1 short-chain-length polyhydroxyalkanoate depolymerase [Dactylosporangium sp. CA-092794]|uniref:extracellular catalytic domain type 1 short-chain-length polyhydroxyalkanoate depolymerase n=1 Tax=Dactylosporangium sp. CA-092794 TaxID=3239929 RepID=UPI003D8B3E07